MFSAGERFGHYRIRSALGEGGMGQVFLAEDLELERLVALKVLPVEVSGDKERIRRFIQEAKAASALNHPNIITIHEIGVVNNIRFIATEYIKGETLREKLKKTSLNLSQILDIAVQAASALEIAHSAKIIHRDIKPENIMIREDHLVKVLDFGLAKLSQQKSFVYNSQAPTREQVKTHSGIILGTVAYMSPEQARGKTVDFRTDIFSLGVVIYEMLTGTQPFLGETSSDVIAAILMKDPPNPRLFNSQTPPELERVILKMLCKNPQGRYQNSSDLLKDLKNLKQSLDFKTKSDQANPPKQFLEAKTEILKADTDKTNNVGTNSIEGISSDRIPKAKPTNKFSFAYKSKFTFILVFGLIALLLTAYFLFWGFSVSRPNTEAFGLYKSGTEALREGTYYKASILLESAVNIDGNFAEAHARLAEAWMELDYFGRAQNEMLKVNELQRRRQSFISFFSRTEEDLYIEAINATILRDFPKAIEIYETFVRRRPNESYVYLDLGRAFEKNEEIDKAIELYEKASHLDAQSGAAFLRLGILRSRKGEYEKALPAFDKAEEIFDRFSNDEGVAEVKFHRGVSLNSQDQLKAALAQFEQVINIPRANKYQKIRAVLQISSLLCSHGKTDEAESYASQALKLAKEERMENLATGGLIDLGNAFFTREEYDKAEQHFRQALEFARNDNGYKNQARALLALGSLFVEQHKADEALQHIKQSLPFFEQGGYKKEVSQAYILHGFASKMKNDYLLAANFFEKASQMGEPTQRALALTGMGTLLTDREQYPKAQKYFEQSNKLYETLGNSFYALFSQYNVADVLTKLGLVEAAKQSVNNAEKIFAEKKISHPSLKAKFLLLKAQIALIEGNFAEAFNITKQIRSPGDNEIAAEAHRINSLSQILAKKSTPEIVQTALKAVEIAHQTKDLQIINRAKLTLAEAFLNAGKSREALEKALEAKDYFVSTDRKESTWRAWLIAARASRPKENKELSRQYTSSSLEILSQLRQDWGEEHFQSYSQRADIKLYLEQAEELK